jgi:hypothetical protein
MKKIIILFAAVCMIVPAIACADIDLSAMSFDELIELKAQIIAEIMSRDDFKEITVPAGKYVVGEDIPAGTYTISCSKYMSSICVNEFEAMYMVTQDSPVGRIKLKNGDAVELTSAVIFQKYAGLGF